MDRKKIKATASPASTETKERRSKIVRAAYGTIAEKGFEGLRMREIAARAGLDHSTLHYYFEGKEALIAGVMGYMIQELSLDRENAPASRRLSPREELTGHFAALLRQAREQPEMFVVLAEIHARSARDPGIRAVMRANEHSWKKFIMKILRMGVDCGDFDPALDVDVGAETAVALIRGLNFGSSGGLGRAERVLQQVTMWLAGTNDSCSARL